MFFPKAEKIPYVHSLHGDERVDPYFWMRDRQNPAVVAYLEAENAYTEATMQHTQPLQTTLYKEMLSRIQETDLSVPYRDGDYYYYSRTETGQAYAIHCRKKGSLEGAEEILLDENLLAAGYEFFELGTFEVSPDHQLLAYSVDTSGAELYTLFFLDLNTRELYPETIPETYYSFAWGNDCRTVFYTQVDAAHRPFKLFRHQLNTAIEADTLVYHEPDDSYYLNIGKTRSEAYLLMSLSSKITSEVRYLKADDPTGEFQVIRPRTVGVEYDIEHHNDVFYVVTNDDAINFKLMSAPVRSPGIEHWQTVIPHRPDVMLLDVSAFVDHLVIYEQCAGLPQIRIRQLSTGQEHYVSFPEPTYEVSEGANPDFNTKTLRFSYTSLVTPASVFDYDLEYPSARTEEGNPGAGRI